MTNCYGCFCVCDIVISAAKTCASEHRTHTVITINKVDVYKICTQQKMNNLFWPDENSIEQCFAAHIPNNIVDNIEQCGQQNIILACFHQPRTGCSFLPVYTRNNEHVSDINMQNI